MKSKIAFKKIYNKLDDQEKQIVDAEISTSELTEKQMPLIRHQLEVKELEEIDDNTSAGWISTISPDHSGDVMLPKGCVLSVYKNNPIVFYNHDKAGQPIAKCIELKVMDEGIWAKWKYSDDDDAQKIKNKVKNGFLNTLSIGFIPVSFKRKGQQGFEQLGYPDANRVVDKWLLLEFSIVSIPDNPNAVIVEKDIDKNIETSESKNNQISQDTNADKSSNTKDIQDDTPKNEEFVKDVPCEIKFKKVEEKTQKTKKIDIDTMVQKKLDEVLATKRGKLLFG